MENKFFKKVCVILLSAIIVAVMAASCVVFYKERTNPYIQITKHPDKWTYCEICHYPKSHKKMHAIGDGKYICEKCYKKGDRAADAVFGCEYSPARARWVKRYLKSKRWQK